MVNVDIKGSMPLLHMEIPFIAHMLQTMSQHPEFTEERQPLLCSGLRVSRSCINEDGEIEETEQMPFPHDKFIHIVKKAMETQIVISITSDAGSRVTKEVPLFPVMLIDIPIAHDAGIVLTQVPEFEMRFEGSNLGFAFHGSLYEFVKQDADEKAKASENEPE